MDKLSIKELISICKERKIKGYSGLKKADILALLNGAELQIQETAVKVHRLNYIGSKFQLLDWITGIMKEKCSLTSFSGKRFADLFAGTGIVSHHFRLQNAIVHSNDAELYSSIISHAFTRSSFNKTCADLIVELQQELIDNKHKDFVGFITEKYSPFAGCIRKFFTVENANRIDYLRNRIEEKRSLLSDDDYKFILASLLLSADAVSNVPAVYGCFLHNFKTKATRSLTYEPIHNNASLSVDGAKTTNSDVLSMSSSLQSDIVYLDPPYNGRQYSKNYFPLNMIALSPDKQRKELPLKGKTGIPESCFLSPFCKKGAIVEEAFEKLFKELNTKWIFLSYNSESTVKKERLLELMGKYGTATVVERDYKRFKSFEYNKDVAIKEYLFCLAKA